jgi:hypothetical protein
MVTGYILYIALLLCCSACLERNVIHAMDSVEWECGDACSAWICVFVNIYMIYGLICCFFDISLR